MVYTFAGAVVTKGKNPRTSCLKYLGAGGLYIEACNCFKYFAMATKALKINGILNYSYFLSFCIDEGN